ncbi:MAG: carbon-nitrogen hydrolase family protein [Verrucomicrobiales bacterium]|nr:carbon-nitrogen hydrolase family protein [Verrucomicrobiales bacterium]
MSPLPRRSAVRLALAQMRVEPGDAEGNRRRADASIRAARLAGAEVVLLPEAMDFGWTHPSAREGAGAIPGGDSYECLQAAAAREGLHVCAGLVERDGDRIFNAAVLFDDRGRLLAHHRKIHELDVGRDLYATGDRLGVVETRWGRWGVMVCADAFAEHLPIARTLGWMGARLILSPCAWAVPPAFDPVKTPYGDLWRESYGPVAREFGLVVAGCSGVGPVSSGAWAGWECIGNSLVIGPEGELACGGFGEAAEPLLVVDLSWPEGQRVATPG